MKPHFPPSRAKVPYREGSPPAEPLRAESGAKRVVVRRPEPPPDSSAPPQRARPEYTKDEIRAFLAVEKARRPRPWGRVAFRGGVILVPLGAIRFLLWTVFGDWAPIAMGLAVLGAIAWMARPLYTDREWG